MRAKQFFYVTAGILLLVVAYSIGAHQAGAQSSTSQVAAVVATKTGNTWNPVHIFTTTGDVYAAEMEGTFPFRHGDWAYVGNVFSSTVGVQNKSMSDVKGAYRGK
jgi:hypothetical protein